MSEVFQFFNLHLPSDLRAWTVPIRGIRRWDDEIQVADILFGPDLVLRHYAFYHRWFEVNCSLSLKGQFVVENGPIDWSFNIDICTPFFSIGINGYSVDLCLDVLVGPDGKQFHIKDEEEFAKAFSLGWFTQEEQAGALGGLEELRTLIEGGDLLCFLSDICPFQPAPVPQPPMRRADPSEVPLLHAQTRHRFFGKRLPMP